MFRNITNERHFSAGQRPTSPSKHGLASAALDAQESSWIGLLSVVSRPALSFLQKYVTGRPRGPILSERGAGWPSGEPKTSFVDDEGELLRHLDDMVPAPKLTYLRCQHDAAAGGLLEHRPGGPVPCLTAESLQVLGIQSVEEVNVNRTGHFSSLRTILSHVVWSSSQEIRPTAGKDWGTTAKTRTWWGSFWGGEENSQSGSLSELSQAEEGTVTGGLCPQQPPAERKAAETNAAFVQRTNGDAMLGENAGRAQNKGEEPKNEGLHTAQTTKGSTPDHRLSDHKTGSGVASAFSKLALVLNPDQDNGYSSLEEEQVQINHLYVMKASGEETESGDNNEVEEALSTSGKVDKEEGIEEELAPSQEAQFGWDMVPSTPQCQNKSIAFIMGCPCSDDDSSQSERESSDEDDDGFDSEGSSDLSDSTDDDDDDDDNDDDDDDVDEEEDNSDSEADSEAERLWSSFCQSLDPYNPRNFTASLQTGITPPRTIPIPTSAAPPLSSQSISSSSPQHMASSNDSCTIDTWDDSPAASEVDEAESLRLWSSFSCSSDPYSPFNFQAPLRTHGPSEAAWAKTRSKKPFQTLPHSLHHKMSSPPEYRKEEAEERLDSGFCEHSSGSSRAQSCASSKKVRFCDDVEEFFASCGEEEEDRRGPWEELARDRCRFLRRCQEVEQSIAYCLQPQHRSLVYCRLTILHVQDP